MSTRLVSALSGLGKALSGSRRRAAAVAATAPATVRVAHPDLPPLPADISYEPFRDYRPGLFPIGPGR